jgi:tetratricopeptide (TPR) repeat protein
MSFIGNELYSIYYKICCEICDCHGDLENAMRYLNQAKYVGRKIGIKDYTVLQMKLEELNKMRRKKNKEKDTGEARECLQLGDLYMQSGSTQEAMEQYRQALRLSKEKDPEIEALSHFKIGRFILQSGSNELEKARNHIVDFQIQCQMIKDKTDSICKKQKEASLML